MQFTYTSFHLPTGTIHECFAECASVETFLRELNRWNGTREYVYKSSDPNVYPKHHCAGVTTVSMKMVKQDRSPEEVKSAGGYWTEYKVLTKG
jgi:hypothetical protein